MKNEHKVIKTIINELSNNLYQGGSGEQRMWLGVYKESLKEYLEQAELLHKKRLQLKTYRNSFNRYVGQVEQHIKSNDKLTEKKLISLTEAVTLARDFKRRVINTENKIYILEEVNKELKSELLNNNNMALTMAGINPEYGVRLLRTVQFFKGE